MAGYVATNSPFCRLCLCLLLRWNNHCEHPEHVDVCMVVQPKSGLQAFFGSKRRFCTSFPWAIGQTHFTHSLAGYHFIRSTVFGDFAFRIELLHPDKNRNGIHPDNNRNGIIRLDIFKDLLSPSFDHKFQRHSSQFPLWTIVSEFTMKLSEQSGMAASGNKLTVTCCPRHSPTQAATLPPQDARRDLMFPRSDMSFGMRAALLHPDNNSNRNVCLDILTKLPPPAFDHKFQMVVPDSRIDAEQSGN
ncbi:hypothetical protein ZWY2020_023865 [Hordeum vulgare]|nr:hypothetical protein ZWY2020_023865 [Hordeum vulgare]